MKAYQIGQVRLPWVNFTPPIRGGVFHKAEKEECVDSDDDDTTSNASLARVDSHSTAPSSNLSVGSNFSSFNSSTTSLDVAEEFEDNTSGLRKRGISNEWYDKYRATGSVEQFPILSSTPCFSAEEYTSKIVQDEVDKDIRQYPSLDAETQGNIVLKYQDLHQKVKDQGFYECRYMEYGKELIRYTLLFVTFLTLLNYGWYITSAAVLGLFWVNLFMPYSFNLC